MDETGDGLERTGDCLDETGDGLERTGDRSDETGDRLDKTGDGLERTSDWSGDHHLNDNDNFLLKVPCFTCKAGYFFVKIGMFLQKNLCE